MTWNYRVVKHTSKVAVYFDIREVYYNGDNNLSWTIKSAHPIGDSPDELKADLKMMLAALDLPVLEEKDGKLVEVEG